MSRWLKLATLDENILIPTPNTLQIPAESPLSESHAPFLHLPAACWGVNTSENKTAEPSAETLIDLFQERAGILEFDAGLTRGAATWQAAFEAFATPEDRAEYFSETGTLKPRFKNVTLAIAHGLVVTFHASGKVSFLGESQ